MLQPSLKVLIAAIAISVISVAQGREWVNASGKYRVEAELVEVQGDSVVLRKADGQLLNVPLAKLSQADRDFVASHAAESNDATTNTSNAQAPAAPPPTREEEPPPESATSDASASVPQTEGMPEAAASPLEPPAESAPAPQASGTVSAPIAPDTKISQSPASAPVVQSESDAAPSNGTQSTVGLIVRLTLLSLLGLLACGLPRFGLAALLGLALGLGIFKDLGWGLGVGIQCGLAAGLLLVVIGSVVRWMNREITAKQVVAAAVSCSVVLGPIVCLASRFLGGATWSFALLDGAGVSLMMTGAAVRGKILADAIERKKAAAYKPTSFRSSSPDTPRRSEMRT